MVSGPYRPHNCMSPGCTRRGQMESYKVSTPVYRGVSPVKPHNCMSPGCTRKGQPETGPVYRQIHNCGSPGCSRRGQYETDDEARERTIRDGVTKAFATGALPLNLPPEPDPFKFNVLRCYSEGGLTLAEVKYHGCTNYEGRKILLMRRDIQGLQKLDPHFLENHENKLLARFAPTQEGWEMGLAVFKSLLKPPA